MDTNETTPQEGTSNFQRYAQDAVGKALDKAQKEAKDVESTNKPVGTETHKTTDSIPTSPDFEGFANSNLENEVFTSDANYKGLDYNRVVGELPDDAQKLLANFRADYTRKTQELAMQRKALEEQQKALINSDFAKNIRTKAETEVEFDPFDDASVQAKIEQEVARRMQEMLTPLQTQYELQQNQYELDRFKADNPDLDNYRTDVAKLLLQNENLSLQQAYFIVKGQKQNEKSRQLEEELNQYKTQAKEYGLKVGGSSRPSRKQSVPDNVRKQGAYAVYEWLRINKSK
jgi:hypothetical protein